MKLLFIPIRDGRVLPVNIEAITYVGPDFDRPGEAIIHFVGGGHLPVPYEIAQVSDRIVEALQKDDAGKKS